MNNNYKYTPKDFESRMPSLAEDLFDFYEAFERYKNTNDDLDEISLKGELTNVLLTIKHRKLNGSLSEDYAAEMESYLVELFSKASK